MLANVSGDDVGEHLGEAGVFPRPYRRAGQVVSGPGPGCV